MPDDTKPKPSQSDSHVELEEQETLVRIEQDACTAHVKIEAAKHGLGEKSKKGVNQDG